MFLSPTTWSEKGISGQLNIMIDSYEDKKQGIKSNTKK
jgi:hypothetical protein